MMSKTTNVMASMRLPEKVVVITGAASGMGRAMAERFAAEGASVVAGDWHAQRLEETVASIRNGGGTITAAQGDIADKQTAEHLVELAVTTYGRLDVLCNNAGVADYMQGVGELSDDIWRRVLSIDLDGPMFTTRRAIPTMIAQGGGSIINVASTAGISGGSAGAAYTAAKHALVGLTRNTAWMYAEKGIRCNAICPGERGPTSPRRLRPSDWIPSAGRDCAPSAPSCRPCWKPPISRRWRSFLPPMSPATSMERLFPPMRAGRLFNGG
jgi:NAD(P)-dependent dehydrogenase (short-subunit alcohol dehydrogenase family)